MLCNLGGWSVGALLATFVMLYCYIWWLNGKFEELTKEIKKK